MPRHLISGAHEWINEIPTVPIYYLAKPQPREQTWEDQWREAESTDIESLILDGVSKSVGSANKNSYLATI